MSQLGTFKMSIDFAVVDGCWSRCVIWWVERMCNRVNKIKNRWAKKLGKHFLDTQKTQKTEIKRESALWKNQEIGFSIVYFFFFESLFVYLFSLVETQDNQFHGIISRESYFLMKFYYFLLFLEVTFQNLFHINFRCYIYHTSSLTCLKSTSGDD